MLTTKVLRQLFNNPLVKKAFTTASTPKFQQLIEKGDVESIKQAHVILNSLEIQSQTLSKKLKQIKQETTMIKSTEQNLLQKLELLQKNLKDQQQQIKLIQRRCDKQIDNAQKYSITKMVKQLLDVADNMKRCSAQCQKMNAGKQDIFSLKLKQTHLILKQTFKKFGIQQFDPTGQIYNPNTSQSMVEVPDPSKPDGTVAMTTQTGYMLKDRVLRSAKVCVYKH